MTSDVLAANVEGVRRRIAEAARRSGRHERDVSMVAITKYVGPDVIDRLGGLGVTDCGENRVLEGLQRVAQVKSPIRWHFVGHLQTNKVRKALERFEVIHAVDRWELAAEIQKQLDRLKKRVAAFVQVNVSGEASKGGVGPREAGALVARLRAECPSIELQGFMTMAPAAGDPEASRIHFRRLRELAQGCGLKGLSMGMTRDFEVAVEEGATHLRVGSALFQGLPGVTLGG